MIYPSASLRARQWATPRVYLTAIAVAIVTYLSIAYFADQIDQRRLEQLRVSRFNTQIINVLGDLDSFLLGEQVEDYADNCAEMEEGLRAVTANAAPETAQPILRAYRRFTDAAALQRSVQISKGIPSAKRIDREVTDPAFDKLEAVLKAFDQRLQHEAIWWNNVTDIAVGLSLLASSLLVASLFLRFQRKVEAVVSLEVQQNLAETSERKLKALFRNTADVLAVVSAEGIVTTISDACERAWGRSASEIVGHTIFEEVAAGDVHLLRRALANVQSDEGAPTLELSMDDGQNGARSFEVHVCDLLDEPSVNGILLTFHDLTERKKYESQLTYHAFHDRLTGLPNRALFLDRLTHRLAAAQTGEHFAVLFIDLDNFKIVNDSLGHEAGDTLLTQVAERLRAAVRPVDTVARLGGDEFTIILDEAATADVASEVADRIQKALVLPVSLGEREVFVTSSIGIVMTKESGPDAAGLLRDADTAMYQAKANGKAALAIFEPGMNLVALDRLELESDLRVAIQEEQFYLAYQPIVDIETGKLREVEALIRWQHPERGVIPPCAFIPLAEETGLICAIGRWALRESFTQLSAWNQGLSGDDRLHLSVNVSGRQFQEKEFVSEVKALVEEIGLDPHLVELEVTETAMLNDLGKMKELFAQLRQDGFQVAIDDFGTGYSSMAYLSQLPVDKLKIDRSFVIPLGSDERADGVVQAMITMARTLGLTITGEGVETEEQLGVLQTMGCDLGQGFLFDRPLSGEAVTKLIRQSEAGTALRRAA